MKVKLLFPLIPFLLFPLVALAQAPPWQWARQGATNGSESAFDITTDLFSSNIYACGTFDGNLNSVYGSSLSSTAGQLDAFVIKYDAIGNLVWGFKFGGSGSDEARAIATDPNGNVYVLGSFDGTCDFDPSAGTFTLSAAGRDGFLAKYNSSGAFQWAVKYGSAGNDVGVGIYADANGIYITGYYEGLVTFNSTSGVPSLATSLGDEDLFGAKYNSAGVLQWLITQGDTKDDKGFEVVADNNNVYFIGTYDDDVMLRNANGSVAASRVSQQANKSSVIISAYTQLGTLSWANNISSTDDNLGLGISQDANSIYITGGISNTASFQYPSPTFTKTASSDDIFLAALSKSAGVFQWVSSQTGSGNNDEVGYDLEVVGNTIIVSGYFSNTLDYSPYGGSTIIANNMDPFLTAFDVNGGYLWNAPYGGNGADLAFGLAVNTTGGIFLCGSYVSGINFGSLALGSANNSNIFVAKIGCDSILANLITPASQTICVGGTPGTISGTVSAGQNYSVQWQTSANNATWINAAGNATNVSYSSPTLQTSTYFRRVVTGGGTCTNYSISPSVFVNVEQPVNPNAGPAQYLCINNPTTFLNAVLLAGFQGNWSVLSGGGTVISPTLANSQVTGLTTGINSLQWTLTGSVCPASSGTVMLNVSSLPSPALAGRDKRICTGTVVLTAVLPSIGSGTWSVLSGPANVLAAGLATTSASGVSTGTNSFLWSVTNGVCPASVDTVNVYVDALPGSVSADKDQTVCSITTSMNAISLPDSRAFWNVVAGYGVFADSTLTTTRIDSLAPGKNVFRWNVKVGVCPFVSDEVIVFRDLPGDTAIAGPDQQLIVPATSLSANTPTFGLGVWQVVKGNAVIDNDTSSNSSIRDIGQGVNVLQWSVKNGSCPAKTDQVTIYLEPLRIPSGFSPNNDGINDNFVIPGVDFYEHADFAVFNRWGSIVYKNEAYKNEWNGTNMTREPLADDTYYFTLHISENMNFSGYIIIKTDK